MKYTTLILILYPLFLFGQIDTSHLDSVPEIEINRKYGFDVINNGGGVYAVVDTFENDAGDYYIEIKNGLTRPELNKLLNDRITDYLKRHASQKSRYVRNARARVQDSLRMVDAHKEKQYYLEKIRAVRKASKSN